MADTNRIEPTTVANAAESARLASIVAPATASNGVPVLATKAVPWVAAVVGAAAIAMTVLPEHTLGYKIAAAVVAFGTLLGIASPGLRKAP